MIPEMDTLETLDRPSLSESLLQAIFHLICVEPTSGVSEDPEKYFSWRLSGVNTFLSRFGNRVDVRGKRVFDFGCGYGSTSLMLAQKGAARVVGVDMDEDRVAFAKHKLVSEFSCLCGKVDFVVPGELKDPSRTEERFDLVISQDCFEHYEDPIAIMNAIRSLLAEGGQVLIGFSPLWKSPFGGHIGYMTKAPWAHLIFPERIIMRERKRYRPDEDARTFAEMRGGLNKMTYAKFLATMRASGYDIDFLETNVSDSRLRAFADLIRRVPFTFEYFTKNLYAIVTPKRAGQELS
jgi:SAM-dependent methyltransferase